jgi:Ca2+-transporting ATPase
MGMEPAIASRGRASSADWHALSAHEAVASVGSDGERGLALGEARARLARFGPNALPEAKSRSALAIFAGQFRSPLIYLLFVAAAIALALGHPSDAGVIAVVVLLNAFVGAFQEGRAERSLAALRRLSTLNARVLRDGREVVLEAREVVPGDVLLLEAGDAVAADARLLYEAALQISEAALTGESVAVSKVLLPVSPETPLADRRNMVFSGTYVTAGRARAVVVATGADAEIGRIATLAERAVQPKTPLEQRIEQLGRTVIYAAAALFLTVNAIGVVRGLPTGEILMVAISQVVGLIPEGLPVAMTIALAVGVQRMARRRAVVRRLAAVETLGSTTVICSDKTGTLTRNEMTVVEIHLADGRALQVTGPGYEPRGEFLEREGPIDPMASASLRELLECAVLCNDSQLEGPFDDEPRWRPLGDPTEVALVTAAVKAGVVPLALRERQRRRAEIPFDPAAKLMATQHDTSKGPRVIVKGAPEVVLRACRAVRVDGSDVDLDGSRRRDLHDAAERMAARALRVLAVAVADGAELDVHAGVAALAGRLTLLGLFGEIDPPRPEVRDAVAACRTAGIRPVMVTGDHKITAQAIATDLGIAREGDLVVDGSDLEALDEAALAARIERVAVFARVHPAQKLRIVDAYQRRNDVVAMTGDGVNDAPALVKADVGVAMGVTGTDVAKDSAEIILADDNFATIVAAVEEGRVVYRNMKKAILLLFSTSIAEVVVLLLALLLGYPPPLAAVQILWINLVTEGLITVNLIMDPAEGDEMTRRPIASREPLLTRALVKRAAFMISAMAASTLGWFALRSATGVPEVLVRTETFTVLAICQWFNVLNCRSEWRSGLSFSLFRNPWVVGGLLAGNVLHVLVVFWQPLGAVFHTVPIAGEQVLQLALVGSLVLWVEELRKLVIRRRLGSRHAAR